MKIVLAGITPAERRLRAEPAFRLVEEYTTRAGHYEPCSFAAFATEEALLAVAARDGARARSFLILWDSAGKSMSSREFAGFMGGLRDNGRQQIVAAIGPASGWSAEAKAKADLLLSLGPMTLPHALAQAVVAEQIYRALTILAGHPYHCGH